MKGSASVPSPAEVKERESSPDWRFWSLFLHSGEWAGERREHQGLPWGWGGMKTNIYVFKWGEGGLVKSNLHSFRRPRVKKESLPERKNPPPHFIPFIWGKFTKAQNSQKRRPWNNTGSERKAVTLHLTVYFKRAKTMFWRKTRLILQQISCKQKTLNTSF